MYEYPHLDHLLSPEDSRSECAKSTDSEDSDMDVDIERPDPDFEFIHTCDSCGTLQGDEGELVSCPYCLRTTETVKRVPDTGDVWRWALPERAWEFYPLQEQATAYTCLEDGCPILCLGGTDIHSRLFEAWCYWCQDVVKVGYADGREAYVCGGCRQGREAPTEYDTEHGTALFWEDWCDWCDGTTNTVKCDPEGSYVQHCCHGCRMDREEQAGEEDWCEHCEEDTVTQEIDG